MNCPSRVLSWTIGRRQPLTPTAPSTCAVCIQLVSICTFNLPGSQLSDELRAGRSQPFQGSMVRRYREGSRSSHWA
jgi:hypothetical protein